MGIITLLITAIIPAYNEAHRIASTLKAINSFVSEVIVIDDASTDNTAEIARELDAKVLTQIRNKGY